MPEKMRKWLPSHPEHVSSVKFWYWTPSKGLMVVYKDHVGLGEMRAFLAAVRDGREFATEVGCAP